MITKQRPNGRYFLSYIDKSVTNNADIEYCCDDFQANVFLPSYQDYFGGLYSKFASDTVSDTGGPSALPVQDDTGRGRPAIKVSALY